MYYPNIYSDLGAVETVILLKKFKLFIFIRKNKIFKSYFFLNKPCKILGYDLDLSNKNIINKSKNTIMLYCNISNQIIDPVKCPRADSLLKSMDFVQFFLSYNLKKTREEEKI